MATMALINGVRLNYVQLDEGPDDDREHLVMVHGLATNMAFWYFQYAPEFARRFRVTLFDLRGHGRSQMSHSGYTPGNLAKDLEGLLDHLGIAKAHFLAHSYGGVVTLRLACAQPQRLRSLVLADSHISAARHGLTEQDWDYGRRLQPLLERHGLDLDVTDPYFGYRLLTRVAQWQVRGFNIPHELAEVVGPLVGRAGGRTASRWLELMALAEAEKELMSDDGLTRDRLQQLDFPILAMYGDRSQARMTGKALLDIWPHAEFRRVRDAGHFFPTSRPTELISGCKRFWRGDFDSGSRGYRDGENGERHFRSDRVFRSGDAWFYTTRETKPIGPFEEHDAAHEGLARFMAGVQT